MKTLWNIFFWLAMGVLAILVGALAAWCGDLWPGISLGTVILVVLVAGYWFLGHGLRAFAILNLLSAILFATGGCASHKSTVYRRTDSDGSVKEITRSATRTLFDSKSRLADNRVESHGPSNAQTIAIGSLAQESAGSNVVALIEKAGVLVMELEKLKTSLPDVGALNLQQGGATAARLAHNQKADGSIPSPATNLPPAAKAVQMPPADRSTEDWLRLLGPTNSALTYPPGSTDATDRQNMRRALRQQLEERAK